ncbi:hypothetical protein LINPERHAP1_LOCUS42754 [Linum perenne]
MKMSNPPSVRKATKLIAPVLFFFFFVVLHNSSYLLPLMLEFSTMTVDKNCMFILCNGILVLIAKSSGLIGNGETSVYEGRNGVGVFELHEEDEEEEEEEEEISEGEKEEVRVVSFVSEDLEEEEEEGSGLLSSEELQRKCEDFINKMKAEIKFEYQQQQLIMVQ